MKKTLFLAAAVLMANPAMASKARLSALGSAGHLSDIQDVFSNPAKLHQHGDWATFEMGNGGTNTTPPQAEGGFSRGMGDVKYGFYLGSHSAQIAAVRTPSTYLTDENPVNLFYASKAGDMVWGVGLSYSNSDKKQAVSGQARKQSATGLTAGVTGSNWDAGLVLGLTNTYKSTTVATGVDTVDFKGGTAIGLNGTYVVDTMSYVFNYDSNSGKDSVTGALQDITKSSMAIGVVNSHKADGADFFYGVKYTMDSTKNKATATTDTTTTNSALPVLAGVEADAASWLVLRASIQQNFILGSTKTETAGVGDGDTVANNTQVNAGLGMKFGKLVLDGTFSKLNGSAATGDLNGNNFLSNASLTYMF